MDKNTILEEAIYDLEGLGIEPRKRNIILPAAVLLAGIFLITASYKTEFISSNANLSSGSLLTGFIMIVIGLVMTISRLMSKGIPFYVPSNEKLRKYELSFDAGVKEKVKKCISEGDLESLTDLNEGQSSAVKAVIYKTSCGELVVAQVQEYVPHSYQPADDIKVFRKGEYIRSAKLM